MDFNKRSVGILFLKRGGFDFYEKTSDRIFNYTFPQELVSALDVINLEELKKQIKAFAQGGKFTKADLMIVLSPDILFEKDFPIQDPNIQNVEIQKFLDIVPFESISTKTLTGDQGVRIIAVNKNLIDAIRISFEELGFLIEGIIPYEYVRGTEGMTSLDNEISRNIIKDFDSLKNASFDFEKSEKKPTPQIQLNTTKAKANSLRLYLMFGVFGLLLVVLFLLLIRA